MLLFRYEELKYSLCRCFFFFFFFFFSYGQDQPVLMQLYVDVFEQTISFGLTCFMFVCLKSLRIYLFIVFFFWGEENAFA